MVAELNEEARSLIRSSLIMEESILDLGLRKWGTIPRELNN